MHCTPENTSFDPFPPRAHAPGASWLSRRRFLLGGMFGAASLAGAGSAANATLVEPWNLAVRRYRAPIRGLPPGLDGLRIAQVSDTHLGRFVPESAIVRAVETALALAPDLVALTGDYVHCGVEWNDRAAALFRPLVEARGVLGVVGVLGNHDWYGSGPAMRASMERVGVRMIDNGRVFLDAGTRTLSATPPPADALCIAGVGDLDEDQVDFVGALGGVPHDMPRLLLSHNPDVAESPALVGGSSSDDAPARVDLMLCGHTHGGQVRLPFLGAPMVPSAYGQKYAGGMARGPACPVIVSRGVGMSILPVRFNCPPEVVEVTLIAS